FFKVQAYREGETKVADFEKGILVNDAPIIKSSDGNGTKMVFTPDGGIVKNHHFIPEYLENQIWNYAYLNAGLTINFNGKKFFSDRGLFDLLSNKIDEETQRYPINHLKGNDIEMALTHSNQYGEEYYSFV